MPNQRAKPTLRRRRLGGLLRGFRTDAGLTVDAAAKAIGWQHSKVSNIENAKAHLPVKDVAELLRIYDVTDPHVVQALEGLAKDSGKQGWWATYTDTITQGYADYISLETDATILRTYNPGIVHGLLQTGAYAREIIAGTNTTRSPDEVMALAEIRKARQSIISRPERRLTVWSVIHESALRHRTAAMQGQIRHLIDLLDLPSITLQIMPVDSTVHPGLNGPFDLFEFPDPWPNVVNVETLRGGVLVERQEDAAVYATAFERIVAAALPVEDTRDILTAILEGNSIAQ
ncbi:helix-turn-helix domain-containing protein [Streptomyces sp. NPDC101455]|uniref:helix-turn-helix domain-containing protein n=1 Tax=Streptomyces sp. NPDC101455 TaxID=3366142 RepID=UPI003800C955